MAKAKRARRSSIRTMSADSSVLDVLESLERAELQSAETTTEPADGEPTPVPPREVEAELPGVNRPG